MTTQNGPAISPNLLKNFNPYDILEPQRDPQVERLIDIGDTPVYSELNASLLDQKPRYDLVDLFQNMYVTPDLVKKNDRASTTNATPEAGTSNSDDSSNTVDFKDFLDKLESGEKYDWAKENKGKSLNELLVGKPRVLVAKLDDEKDSKEHDARKPKVLIPKLSEKTKQNGPTVSKDDDSEAIEDLIADILAKKNMEKRILEEINNRSTTANNPTQDSNGFDDIDCSRIKVLSAPIDVDEKVATKVTTTKTNSAPKCAKLVDEEYEIAAELSRLKLNNNLRNPDNIKPSSVVKLDGQIDNTLNFQLIAMKKDEKAFRKKYIMKPESQTCKFTKGADFYEKSVVLPQIMARIKKRQDYLLERNNQKRRLVLDTSKPSDYKSSTIDEVNNDKKKISANAVKKDVSFLNGMRARGVENTLNKDGTWGKVNPIVLMADCNKERLKAFEQGRLFQNFIKNGK